MPAIKERPILFSAPMVRAILEGRKTVTRRVCKPQPSANAHTTCASGNPMGAWWETGKDIIRCPYGKPGERLWVRETWSDVNLQGAPGIAYRADGDVRDLMEDASFLDEDGAFNYDDPRSKPYHFSCWSEDLLGGKEGRWRPSISRAGPAASCWKLQPFASSGCRTSAKTRPRPKDASSPTTARPASTVDGASVTQPSANTPPANTSSAQAGCGTRRTATSSALTQPATLSATCGTRSAATGAPTRGSGWSSSSG